MSSKNIELNLTHLNRKWIDFKEWWHKQSSQTKHFTTTTTKACIVNTKTTDVMLTMQCLLVDDVDIERDSLLCDLEQNDADVSRCFSISSWQWTSSFSGGHFLRSSVCIDFIIILQRRMKSFHYHQLDQHLIEHGEQLYFNNKSG